MAEVAQYATDSALINDARNFGFRKLSELVKAQLYL